MSRHPKYELIWLTVYWARPLPYEQALGALQHLASLTHAPQIICETRATTHGVDYLVATQRRFIPKLHHTIEQLVPGTLVVEADTDDRQPVLAARKVVYSAPERALSVTDNEAATRGVLASLSGLHGSETIVLQVVLGNRHAPRELPGTAPRPVSVKMKAASFGFGAIVRLGVTAATAERRQRLTTGVLSSLRAALSPGLELRLVPERVGVLNNPSPYWPLFAGFTRLSVGEVTLMAGWPVGAPKQPYPGLPPAHPTLLRPSFTSRGTDCIVATSTVPGYTTETLGISERDSRRHLWIMGPTGTGKSSLLLNLIHHDLTAGRPVIVIEPKDLITDLLSVIPKERIGDVVLLDPLDESPTGFNPLDLAGRTPALVADQLFSFFVALYGREGIGPRSADILRLALDAVAHAKNSTLAMLPLLLTNPSFRHHLTSPRIAADPLHAAPFWAWFESLSPDARTQIIAPLQNKLRMFLQEPLRSVLAQPSPRFNLRDVFTKKKILLVPLQSGVLGSESAQLLGALVVNELWEALKKRVAVPEKHRRTVMVYLDEAQVFLDKLPIDVADALAMSRSLGASFHLSHQYTDQLSPKLLRAFESNARSKIVFQLTGRDASYAANLSPGLEAADFTALPNRHIYAQLVRDGTVTAWASGRTRDTPAPCSDPAAIRASSRRQYGQPRAAVEQQLRDLVATPATNHKDDPATAGKRQRRTP